MKLLLKLIFVVLIVAGVYYVLQPPVVRMVKVEEPPEAVPEVVAEATPAPSPTGVVEKDTPPAEVAQEFVPGDGPSASSAPSQKLAPDAIEAKTVADLRAWAELKAGNGPQGRPLPLAASWAAGAGSFVPTHYTYSGELPSKTYSVKDFLLRPSPSRMVEEIKKGRHVMITFEDVVSAPGIMRPPSRFDDEKFSAFFDDYYRPALEYAHQHKLPISIRGWNLAKTVVDVENGVRTRISEGEDSAKVIRNGEYIHQVADPFGPVKRWEEFGALWMGHEVMKKMQEIYPDPPMVIFVDNHEAGKITDAKQLDDSFDRFVGLYGKDRDLDFRARKIREGYAERYAAMFAAARSAFVAPAWRDNSVFIAYNNTSPQILGRGASEKSKYTGFIHLDPESGYTEYRKYDGATPEYYDNDWQAPQKSDSSPWSPQIEASNLIAYQDAKVWSEFPNFYWSASLWGGDMPANIFGRLGRYLTDDFEPAGRWNMYRYTGMLQFGLWMLRPREYREFRGEDDLRGFYGEAWNALVESVDRVWNDPTLAEFWKFGRLVHNPVFGEKKHYFGSVAAMPAWMREMDRWFLLTSNVNAPESTWPPYHSLNREHALKVFALALELGEKPKRRWLIYAHSPLGAVAGSKVELPGKGNVLLDYIPQSGSFFLVDESSGKVSALKRGGPTEVFLEVANRHVKPGSNVAVEAVVRHPAGSPFASYTWRVPGQPDRTSTSLTRQTFTFPHAGEFMINLEAVTETGEKVIGQTPIWVRSNPPDEETVIDLPLSVAYSEVGPWGTELESGELLTFRYLPNASVLSDRDPILLGGKFVNDPEMGSVLELDDSKDGVVIPRSNRTIMSAQGHSDLAIGFRFKADDVQRLQQLYGQGWNERPGINIYLEDGKLHAGSWCMTKDAQLNFEGEWISTPVRAGKWYHVRFVMRDADSQPRPNVATLYLDGKEVGSASAARLPRHFGNPRLSVAGLKMGSPTAGGRLLGKDDYFKGRMAEFTFSIGAAARSDKQSDVKDREPLRLGTPEKSSQDSVVRAINIGGDEVTGSSGIVYERDSGGKGGTVQTLLNTLPVQAETDQDVYRSFRTGPAIGYEFDLPNGEYTLTLKFIEPEHRNTARKMNVSLQGVQVLKDLDVQAKVGVLHEFVVKLPVRVTNGKVELELTGSTGDALLAGVLIEKRL